MAKRPPRSCPRPSPTRLQFLAAYRSALNSSDDPSPSFTSGRIDDIVARADDQLDRRPGSKNARWAIDREAREAFREIGCRGPLTMKALRSLPDDGDREGFLEEGEAEL